MKESILNYERRLESIIGKIRQSSVSEKDKKLIFGFMDECFIQGLSKGRVIKYLYYLVKLSEWLSVPFEKAEKENIKDLVGKIERSHYSDATKMELKICIKKFYRWLNDSEDDPPTTKWIKSCTKKMAIAKLPEEMITEDEVARLINAASSPRDRAFISTLYESGCRISEILFLRFKNIKFDEHGAVLLVPYYTKTGTRRIRLVSSVAYLADWINRHPVKNDPDYHVWITSVGKTLDYNSIRRMLKKAGEKAGVKKRLNPHNFRHSRATFFANHLTEAQMKEYFGWTQGSKMASIYVHLSGRDVDEAVLKYYGRNTGNETKKSILGPKDCRRCREENPGTNKFCSKCGMPLDRETMIEVVENDLSRKEADSLIDKMLEDPQFKNTFLIRLKDALARG